MRFQQVVLLCTVFFRLYVRLFIRRFYCSMSYEEVCFSRSEAVNYSLRLLHFPPGNYLAGSSGSPFNSFINSTIFLRQHSTHRLISFRPTEFFFSVWRSSSVFRRRSPFERAVDAGHVSSV